MAQKRKNKSTGNNVWLIGGAAVMMLGIVWWSLRPAATDATDNPPAKLALTQTLSPEMFTGKARAAYQAAKDVPEVLAQLPCFCGCMSNFGHKNNLYCFADEHGASCDLCQDIALDAHELYKSGASVESIRGTIRGRYSRYAP